MTCKAATYSSNAESGLAGGAFAIAAACAAGREAVCSLSLTRSANSLFSVATSPERIHARAAAAMAMAVRIKAACFFMRTGGARKGLVFHDLKERSLFIRRKGQSLHGLRGVLRRAGGPVSHYFGSGFPANGGIANGGCHLQSGLRNDFGPIRADREFRDLPVSNLAASNEFGECRNRFLRVIPDTALEEELQVSRLDRFRRGVGRKPFEGLRKRFIASGF